VRIAIDDFGVGFSSLSQLKHLPPIDMLKIDKSFIEGVILGDDRAIVAAILSLTDVLGIATIAEGVERQEQADELVRLGCELAQGFLYARPEPPETIESKLLTSLGSPLVTSRGWSGRHNRLLVADRLRAAGGATPEPVAEDPSGEPRQPRRRCWSKPGQARSRKGGRGAAAPWRDGPSPEPAV
jgi:hypothetical protein